MLLHLAKILGIMIEMLQIKFQIYYLSLLQFLLEKILLLIYVKQILM